MNRLWALLCLAPWLLACGSDSVHGEIPASAKPKSMTPAPTMLQSFGSSASGNPAMNSTPPLMKPTAPTDKRLVQTLSPMIANAANMGNLSADSCASLNLMRGQGFCSDATYLSFCPYMSVQNFDCSTMLAGTAVCGYQFDGMTTYVTCAPKATAVVGPTVSANMASAYTTMIPCSAGQEGAAVCHGTAAYFCAGGSVSILDCALFTNPDAKNAGACSHNAKGNVDCFW